MAAANTIPVQGLQMNQKPLTPGDVFIGLLSLLLLAPLFLMELSAPVVLITGYCFGAFIFFWSKLRH